MKNDEKKAYLESYQAAKKKGVPFFPDVLFKDAVVSLIVFLVLIALAYFVGAPLESRANPADATYTPRPEWYFLFLFQLLKYFPGRIEFLGVVVLPTLAILGLLLLPYIDRSTRRHFSSRPLVLGFTSLLLLGGIFLTIQSVREAPPPVEAATGDPVAALYVQNCSGCHGNTITVAAGTNLHAVIAQGKHEGMPPWSGDLTNDQIDALAGFILSPGGSKLFSDNCGGCHQVSQLVLGNPLELRNALEQGKSYTPHASVEVPDWSTTLTSAERTALLNFLVAPDGQRLFATYCAPCHGQAVPFAGDEQQLQSIIEKGGMHLAMPPWKEKLSAAEIDTLTNYVLNPASVPDGKALFDANCASCHGQRVPAGTTVDATRQMIAGGGPHETMPVWGSVLTAEQTAALVSYTLDAAKGTSLDTGRKLFATNCSPCHGEFGEGGLNPTRPGDIIAPISTGEYLKTRDDYTLRAVIAQGQPDFGMSPFASSAGGPLDDDQIDALVAYIRSWEAKPPVELPPEIAGQQISLDAGQIFKDFCAQCHGAQGEGGIGPAFADAAFQARNTDQNLFDTINNGHQATAMIAWGGILTSKQIQGLVTYIRQLNPAAGPTPTVEAGVAPAIPHTLVGRTGQCLLCHGAGAVKPYPDNHAGRSIDTCLTCHQPAEGAPAAGETPTAAAATPALSPTAVATSIVTPTATTTAETPTGEPTAQTGTAPAIPHTLVGREGQCLLCHAAGSIKPYPENHAGRTVDTCLLCHQPAAATTTPATPEAGATATAAPTAEERGESAPAIPHTLVGREGRCLVCHATGSLAPFPASHAGRGNETCLLCHQPES